MVATQAGQWNIIFLENIFFISQSRNCFEIVNAVFICVCTHRQCSESNILENSIFEIFEKSFKV